MVDRGRSPSAPDATSDASSVPVPDPPLLVGPLEESPALELSPLPSRVLAFIDDGVPARFTDRVESFLSGIPRGEAALEVRRVEGGEIQKSVARFADRIADCGAAGLDRDALLVAVGGGAVGDAIGFTASTWHRGVRWIAVPTTLVAMVDAHLGGKTALNHGAHKNQLGTFWWPEAIYSDPRFLETLPPDQLRSGWGELIKSAWIGDASLVEEWEAKPPLDATGALRPPTLEELSRAAAVKRRIVASDPRESDLRRVLNFGHTLGHALETLPGAERTHGEAVAVGMVFAAQLAESLGIGSRAESRRLSDLLSRLGFSLEWPLDRTAELLANIAVDKKNRGGLLHMVLPVTAGQVTMVPTTTESMVRCLEKGIERTAP